MNDLDFEEFKLKYNFIDQADEVFKSYVYEVTSNIDNKKYIGFRTSKQTDLISDFWSYGSSSCRKNDILKNPNNYSLKILKVFDNRLEALYYESFLHKKLNISINDNYFNRANSECVCGHSDVTGTVSVVVKDTGERKRINLSEYYNNPDKYVTYVSGSVTVRFRGKKTFFNVTKEEFYKNRELYFTTGEGIYFIKDGDGFRKIKDYEYDSSKHTLLSTLSTCVLCRLRNSDDLWIKLPKDLYNKIDFETPREVVNRPENKNKLGVETLDGKFVYIKLEEWDAEKHKPLKLNNVKRLDENKKIIEKQNIIKRKRINVYNKNLEIYESIFDNLLEPFHDIINEPLIKCILDDKILKLPKSIYKKFKEQNRNIEYLGAPKGVVPVFDTLTNKNTRIHKDIFYDNRDRYIALSSKKMRNLNRN